MKIKLPHFQATQKNNPGIWNRNIHKETKGQRQKRGNYLVGLNDGRWRSCMAKNRTHTSSGEPKTNDRNKLDCNCIEKVKKENLEGGLRSTMEETD